LHKECITQENGALEFVAEFVVEEKPACAGIDPYNKWIDRDPADNLFEVEMH